MLSRSKHGRSNAFAAIASSHASQGMVCPKLHFAVVLISFLLVSVEVDYLVGLSYAIRWA